MEDRRTTRIARIIGLLYAFAVGLPLLGIYRLEHPDPFPVGDLAVVVWLLAIGIGLLMSTSSQAFAQRKIGMVTASFLLGATIIALGLSIATIVPIESEANPNLVRVLLVGSGMAALLASALLVAHRSGILIGGGGTATRPGDV